nr:endonuclease V [Gottschalkia acidurici]
MKVNYIHDFNLKTEEELLKVQTSLKEKINLNKNVRLEDINICAGVDLAYWDEDEKSYGVCSIVVIDYKTNEVLEKCL